MKTYFKLIFPIPFFILAFPLINLIQPRQKVSVKPSTGKDFAYISNILQEKCSDCHTPHKTTYPFYFSLPVASKIISRDIANAQNTFIITEDQLAGKVPLEPVQIAHLEEGIQTNAMPPLRYKVMHWKSFITNEDQQEVKNWVNKNRNSFCLKPMPHKNPFEPELKKIALGKCLYNDKRLSADNTIACATCHQLDKGGTDQMVNSIGIHGQHGPINSPTVYNAAFNFRQFWDGRVANLQEQANGPVNNPIEMGSNWTEVIAKLQKDPSYVSRFNGIYKDGISSQNITDAIASFEQTLLTPNSRFDQFLSGNKIALNADEQKGYGLFLKYNCAVCHAGVNLGGLSFEKMGVKKDYFARRGNLTQADNGRYNVTRLPSDLHKFKVPTLRNIEVTAPYFHDGYTSDLPQAVHVMAEYQTGHVISQKESQLIAAFLRTLTGVYNGKPVH